MSTIAQLSQAAGEALRDAESKKAATAAHFLRVQIHELFRLARLHVPQPDPAKAETEPLVRKNRDHA